MSETENKVRYAVTNGDDVIALVYESNEYGRTMVILEKLDLNYPIGIWDLKNNCTYGNPKFLNFIWEMLPAS